MARGRRHIFSPLLNEFIFAASRMASGLNTVKRAAVQFDYAHAAWEHVRSQLTALLAGSPLATAEATAEAAKPGSNDSKFDYHE